MDDQLFTPSYVKPVADSFQSCSTSNIATLGVVELLVATSKINSAPVKRAFEGIGSAPTPFRGMSIKALEVPEINNVPSEACVSFWWFESQEIQVSVNSGKLPSERTSP